MKKEKICGIYKITSPTGKVYIGESVDVTNRINQYKSLSRIVNQNKIHNSLKKYGWEKHIFEIIEECEFDELKCRERYWQDFYDVLGENGLNLKLTECGEQKQVHSEETKEKMSVLKKEQYSSGIISSNWKYANRKPLSEEGKLKISLANMGENNGMFGRKEEESHKQNRMKNMLNKDRWNKGKTKDTDERIKNMSEKLLGREAHNKIKHKLERVDTGDFWEANSLTELSKICPLSMSTLQRLKSNRSRKENYILSYE